MVPILVLGVLYCIVQLATVEVAVGQLVSPNIVCYTLSGAWLTRHRGGQRTSDVKRGSSNPATFMCVMHGVMSRSVLVSDWFIMQQVTLNDHFSGFHTCLLYSE